jgi:hypothetical protein
MSFIDRNLIRNNITFISTIIFIIIYALINYIKPNILYNENKELRQFGIGYKNKTILPCWLLTILISIFSYYVILYIIAYPNLV